MFLLRKGEVEGRWDSYYYCALRQSKLNFKYQTEKIEKLVKTFSGGTPSKENHEFWENGTIPWASAKDIKTFHLVKTEDFITENAVNDSATKIAPKGTVLLVVRSGILIHSLPVTIVQQPTAINQDLKGLIIKDKRILPDYLAVFFKVFEKKLLPIISKHSTTVQSINTEQFDKLEIPLPTIEMQNSIANLYQKATETKLINYKQAKTLLASINDYLVDALGITLPPEPAKTWQNQTYLTDFYSVNGGRFDPYYNDRYFVSVDNSIRNSHYKSEELGNLIIDLKNGVEIREYVTQEEDSKAYRYLRVTDMTKDGISDKSIKLVSIDEIPNKIKLSKNSVLISRSGSLGLANIVEEHIADAILSSHIFKVEIDSSKVTNNFLVEIIRSTLGQLQVFRKNNGGVIPELNQEALKSILIPLPPKLEQEKIASHIRTIREEAKALRAAGDTAMEEAKKEVEKMLLR